MSPRGADSGDAMKCWRVARAAHCLPSTTCTFAARATSASANSTKNPCTTATRLGGFIVARARKNHDLSVSGNVHAEPALDGDAECLPRRCITNLAFEIRALALERPSSAVERRQTRGLADADRPSPDDR